MVEPDQILRYRLTVGALIVVAFLFTFLTIACAVQRWRPASRLPEGYVVHMCAGSNGRGRFRVGVWWLSPYARDVPPWAFVSRSFPACAFVPWLPLLPQHGSVVFP